MTPQERVRELYRRRECTNLGHGLSCPNCNGSNPWGPSPEEILSAILAAEIEALEWAAKTAKLAKGIDDAADRIRAKIKRRKGESSNKPSATEKEKSNG